MQRVNGILVASMQKSAFYMLFTWTTCAIAGVRELRITQDKSGLLS